jgi:hypothetical protein
MTEKIKKVKTCEEAREKDWRSVRKKERKIKLGRKKNKFRTKGSKER